MKSIKFVVDKSEPKKILEKVQMEVYTNEKFEEFNINIKKQGLPAADLAVPELGFGVERKTIEDFIASIFDGRVFKQIYKMVHSFEFPFIFVSGSMLKIKSKSNIRSLLTTCTDFQVRYNIKIIFLPNDDLLVYYFVMLAYKYHKDKTQGLTPFYKLFRPSLTNEDQEILTLMGMHNIGVKTAKLLLKEFGCIKNIFNASIEDLKEVKGIGNVMATRIYNVSNGIKEEKEKDEEEEIQEKKKYAKPTRYKPQYRGTEKTKRNIRPFRSKSNFGK